MNAYAREQLRKSTESAAEYKKLLIQWLRDDFDNIAATMLSRQQSGRYDQMESNLLELALCDESIRQVELFLDSEPIEIKINPDDN